MNYGICGWCNRHLRLTKAGVLYKHGNRRKRDYSDGAGEDSHFPHNKGGRFSLIETKPPCCGSGQKPNEVK